MKITDVKLMDPLYVPKTPEQDAINASPMPSYVASVNFLQVFTDEGITGICQALGNQALNKVTLEGRLKPLVVGEYPLDTERIWSKQYWGTLANGRRGTVIHAISAMDNAIWDLKGKILNQPVHKLLGDFRDAVPSYGSGINLHLSIDELLQQMTDFVKEGFPMVKMKIGRRDTHEDLERIRLVREAIGPKIDLAVDVNNGWSLQTAIRMSRKMEPYDIYWLEEPILVDEIHNLATLARETRIPIAVGETYYTKWEFKELMEQGAVGIAQADPGICGGVTEFIKIAALADAYGLPVCPHHSPYVDVPLLAAVPNGMIHEHIDNNTFAMEQVGIDPIAPKNGEIVPSTKPGFGIELKNEDALAPLRVAPSPEKLIVTTKKGWRWPPYL